MSLIHTTIAGNGISQPEYERGIQVDPGTVVLKNSLLADNGGPTQTMAKDEASDARDAGPLPYGSFLHNQLRL